MGYSRLRVGVFSAVAVVLAVAVTGFIYEQNKNSKLRKLAIESSAIDSLYNQETLAFQRRVEKEKDKLPKDAAPNYSNSMALFADFARKYSSEPAGWEAAIRSATYYIQEKNYKEAKNVLEPVVNKLDSYALLAIKLRSVLAGVYLEEGDYPKALKELDFIETIPNNPMLNQVWFLHARALYLSGNKAEASKFFDRIISSPTDTSGAHLQEQAKIWLSYLNT